MLPLFVQSTVELASSNQERALGCSKSMSVVGS